MRAAAAALSQNHPRVPHAQIEIPFPFYRDSITLFQTDPDGGEDEWRWKAFYEVPSHRHMSTPTRAAVGNERYGMRTPGSSGS